MSSSPLTLEAHHLPAFGHLHLAAEDATYLAGMDSALIEKWADARIVEYNRRIYALRSLHNAVAPIHRTLPTEILIYIFTALRPSRRKDNGIRLLHVCRYWRSLLLNTSEFWVEALTRERNVVNARQSTLKRLESLLNLTGTRSIPLSFYGFTLPALEAVTPHAHRISSLTLTITVDDIEPLNAMLRTGVPLLRNLSVAHRMDHFQQKWGVVALDLSLVTQLQTLRHPFQPLTVSFFDNRLRELEIFNCQCAACDIGRNMAYTSLVQILNRCPSLEVLKITRVDFFSAQRPLRDFVVDLPVLRQLQKRLPPLASSEPLFPAPAAGPS